MSFQDFNTSAFVLNTFLVYFNWLLAMWLNSSYAYDIDLLIKSI
jgi:hypothetical protein